MIPAELAAAATGAGLTVAVVDSGVNFGHPHLRLPGRGFAVERHEGALVVRRDGHADRFGHGTCCAALVHTLAPGASLFAVRVTAERATTDAERLARGIELALEEAAHIVLVPMGTRTVLPALQAVVAQARARGALVVAPLPSAEVLPGGLADALGVGVLDGVDVALRGGGVVADGHARPAEGLPTNFYGPSLSAARAAAALARHAELSGGSIDGPGFKSILPVR